MSKTIKTLDKRISLIVPVYNEGGTILQLLDEIKKYVQPNYLVYIIYDFDEDDTLKRREEIESANDNIRFVKNAHSRGVIGAFKTGFDIAKSEFIVPIMADLSDMPETVNVLYEKIHEGYDLVVASRYMPGGQKIGGPKTKLVLSRLSNLSLNYITDIGLHDITNAFIMYRKHVIDNVEIRSRGGFEITMEIIAKSYLKGYKMTEVPTTNRDRAAGDSKFKLIQWMMNYLFWYFFILLTYVAKKFRLIK